MASRRNEKSHVRTHTDPSTGLCLQPQTQASCSNISSAIMDASHQPPRATQVACLTRFTRACARRRTVHLPMHTQTNSPCWLLCKQPAAVTRRSPWPAPLSKQTPPSKHRFPWRHIRPQHRRPCSRKCSHLPPVAALMIAHMLQCCCNFNQHTPWDAHKQPKAKQPGSIHACVSAADRITPRSRRFAELAGLCTSLGRGQSCSPHGAPSEAHAHAHAPTQVLGSLHTQAICCCCCCWPLLGRLRRPVGGTGPAVRRLRRLRHC